jgi:hypothetical protein
MPRYFIGDDGYFEAITDIATPAGAAEVPRRPRPDATWDGSEWDAPSLTVLKARKLEALQARRWKAEYGGATIGGASVDTSEKTRAILKSEHDFAIGDAEHTVPSFKRGPGDFVVLTAPEVIALALGVRAHVAACFANEEAISVLINAATTAAALDEIDIDAGWP